MKPVAEVVECSVIGPNSVRLRFRDGWAGTLDIKPALRGPVFETLLRPEKFRQVTIRDGTLVWPDGADICPTVLRYWCELGRVCTQGELDTQFESRQAPALPADQVAESKAKYGRKQS